MQYDVTQYPEGYERIRDEELVFLPDIKMVREGFMNSMILWMVQM